MKTRKILSNLCIVLGILAVITAGALMVHNIVSENNAQSYSQSIVEQIMLQQQALFNNTDGNQESGIAADGPTITPLPSDSQTAPSAQQTTSGGGTMIIGGQSYSGVLDIPNLGLLLPVQSSWSYPQLNQTPCVYYGSLETHDLIIIAHNYKAHFGNLNNLSLGNQVSFMAADGTIWVYQLTSSQILKETEVETMLDGDWDLSLVTCQYTDNTFREIYRFTLISPA